MQILSGCVQTWWRIPRLIVTPLFEWYESFGSIFGHAAISIRCKLYHVCCHFEASRGGAFFSAFLFHGRDHLCSSWRSISRLDRCWNCTDECYIFSPTSTSSATTLGLSDICLNIFKHEMWMMGLIHIYIYVYSGLLEEPLITEAEEPYWCNMDHRPLPPGMNVGSLVSSK